MLELRNYPFYFNFFVVAFIFFIHKLGYINNYPYIWINIKTYNNEKSRIKNGN